MPFNLACLLQSFNLFIEEMDSKRADSNEGLSEVNKTDEKIIKVNENEDKTDSKQDDFKEDKPKQDDQNSEENIKLDNSTDGKERIEGNC